MSLQGARGEHLSFQVLLRPNTAEPLHNVSVTDQGLARLGNISVAAGQGVPTQGWSHASGQSFVPCCSLTAVVFGGGCTVHQTLVWMFSALSPPYGVDVFGVVCMAHRPCADGVVQH